MKYIETMMDKFRVKHDLHISVYGDNNQKRLTGHHETSSFSKFSYGVANRAASIRIPTATANA
jgi:glutamine synthetase